VKVITLIRHTTPRIASGICYGQLDLEVADSFEHEAAVVASWLPPVDLIISSPLQRAHKLAAYLATRQHCELHLHEGLKELNFGDWEGRAWQDIPRVEIDQWSAEVMNYAPPNGESPHQMQVRVQTMLQALMRLPWQHIALVAHGGSIRAVLAEMAGIPLVETLKWHIDFGAVISTVWPGQNIP
jgi:alpha-ribazole phosphatase